MVVACHQLNVAFADPEANLRHAVDSFQRLPQAALHVFSECFLTGYCVGSLAQAQAIALPLSELSEFLSPLQSLVNQHESTAVIGLACTDTEDRVYNGAAVLRPHQHGSLYAKTHLPHLGLDRFVTPGDSLECIETSWGSLGFLVCFDLRYPEAARTLALRGADIIALPTNWPNGAECSANHICIARAAENRVFFAACNRVGHENGFTFFGQSKIVSPTGQVLACAGDGEESIFAEIDLTEARTKRTVNIPGEYEIDVMGCRRPELYEGLR